MAITRLKWPKKKKEVPNHMQELAQILHQLELLAEKPNQMFCIHDHDSNSLHLKWIFNYGTHIGNVWYEYVRLNTHTSRSWIEFDF